MQQPNTVVVTRPVYYTVDDTDPRYRCCCGCMSVVTGAIIIGVLEILATLVNIGFLIHQQVTDGIQNNIYYESTGDGIAIILVVLLFVGIYKKHHWFVLPHLISQIIGIVIMIISGIYVIVMAVASGSILAFLIVVIILFVLAALEIWFFVVILKLFRYFIEKRSSTLTSVVQYSYQQHQQFVGPQPEHGHPSQGYIKYP